MATVSVERSDALTSQIQSAVAALARDLEPGELSLSLASKESLALGLIVRHSATFSISTATGKGPLPQNVSAMHSNDILQVALEQRLEQVRQEAGGLMDEWVREQGGEYRSQLPPQRCQRERPVLGVQHVCSSCGGKKQLTCHGCSGHGRHSCSSCGGRGKVSCTSCGGSGQSMCGSCGGAGGRQEAYNEYRWDPQTNSGSYVFAGYRSVPCSGCGGSGKIRCSCYDGTQTCFGCSGTGNVTCGTCRGSGIVPCDTCAATGFVHHTGWIHCSVNRSIQIDVAGNNPEDQQALRQRVAFDRLAAMTSPDGMRLYRHGRGGHTATLEYFASVPLERAEADVRGQRVSLRAYGPRHEIFDYHDLVGKLLEPDLVHLENSLEGQSVLKSGGGPSLASATKRFLGSEIHALIAEAPPKAVAAAAHGKDAAKSPAIDSGRAVRNALLLAPVRRLFWRSGILLKIVILFFAFQFVAEEARLILQSNFFRAVLSFGVVAGICYYFERRVPAETTFRHPHESSGPKGAPPADAGANAMKALEQPIARGMLTPGYLDRAGAAIGKAVPMLYGPLVLPMALWVTAGVTGLFFVARMTFFGWSMNNKTILLAALTAVAWFIVERQTYTELQSMLGPNLYERLKGQFGRARNHYRLLPLAGFLFAWFTTSWMVGLLR